MKKIKSTKESDKKIDTIYMDYEKEIEKNAKNEYIKKFAKNFNKLLEDKGLTNKQFASDARISPASISNYRSGKTMPTADILILISQALDVSVTYLLGIDECKKYSAEQVHNMLGLDEFAIEHLYSLRHNIPEFKELDNDEPISNVFEKQLKMLSLLIADKRNLIYILNTCNRYIETKQELMELKRETVAQDIFRKTKIEDLTQKVIHIRAEIQEYLYSSLDYITDKLLRKESKK